MSSYVQAVVFDNTQWTVNSSKHWLKRNKFQTIKPVHKTENTYRFRIENPENFKRFITKKLKNGINLIIGYI